MYSPLTIANFFIKKGIEFSDSVVEAWRFGPIIPEIYDAFKAYGNLPLKHVIDNKESINKEVKNYWRLYGIYTEDIQLFFFQILLTNRIHHGT